MSSKEEKHLEKPGPSYLNGDCENVNSEGEVNGTPEIRSAEVPEGIINVNLTNCGQAASLIQSCCEIGEEVIESEWRRESVSKEDTELSEIEISENLSNSSQSSESSDLLVVEIHTDIENNMGSQITHDGGTEFSDSGIEHEHVQMEEPRNQKNSESVIESARKISSDSEIFEDAEEKSHSLKYAIQELDTDSDENPELIVDDIKCSGESETLDTEQSINSIPTIIEDVKSEVSCSSELELEIGKVQIEELNTIRNLIEQSENESEPFAIPEENNGGDSHLAEITSIPPISKIDAEDDDPSISELRCGPQVMGPSYILALKGESVHLRIKVAGYPLPVVTWSRAGKILQSNDRLQVEGKGEFSSVNIENVNYDDNGRYVAKLENELGTIIHTANLSVEGPPEPPSRSPIAAFNEAQNNISISWSGSPYDGGSALKGYHLYISQDEEEWTLACQSVWLTATVSSPERGSSYRFRVHAENAYGVGLPSQVSIPVVVQRLSSPDTTETSKPESCNGNDETGKERDTPIRLGSYLDYYEKGEELGKGRFGVVFKVTHKESRKEYASKIIKCIKTSDKDKVRQEVEIMNTLRHPKLIELVDAFETAREIVIITEKINGGELFERVVADDFTLTEFDCVGFMRQITDGVRFIHSKNIIHLDLKPENILCLTRSTYSIKIIDFGLSQKYDSTIPLRVLFGTPEFVAPEIINYEPISPYSDMWALGVITYVLLSGLSPFMGDTDSETFANITAADFDFEDDAFSSISRDAKEFISSLLVKRQEKRLTADECLSHKWLAYPEPTKNIVIPTDKLKRFIIRRKWQKTGNAIRALGRITMLYSTRRSSEQAAAAAAAASTSTDSNVGGTISPANSASRADSGICLSPTTESPSTTGLFDPASKLRVEESEPIETKRMLQRQPRVDSSSLT